MANFSKAAKAGVSAAMPEIGKSLQENFNLRQSQFKPLVAATVKRRISLGFSPAPILVASGTLQQHIADERSDITTSGSVTSGSVSPSTSAKPEYGDKPISEYAGALNKVREFWIIDNPEQINRIGRAMMKAFTEEFNNGG